jgi:cytosine deaminase
MHDICISNAKLRAGELVDIAISAGHIAAIRPAGTERGDVVLDARSRLVLPGFIDPHLHIDKALTASRLPPRARGTFQESIDLTLDLRERYTHEDLLDRGTRVLLEAISAGTTTIRLFADVGTVGGLLPVRSVLGLRNRFKDVIDIQVVAFPQEGIVRDPGADALLQQAMESGADVVGAFPWFELGSEEAQTHLDFVFELAKRYDADIHAFVDDEPISPHIHNLEQLARTTIREGWEGRVVASHACGLSSYDNHLAEQTMRMAAAAGISICSNAHISLVSKCENAPEPRPRGITRVRELLDFGVNLVTGQDDVADPYYPFGRGDMLEVASFLAHTAQLYRPADVELALDAIAVNAARALRLEDYGLREGARADLVVLHDAETPVEAIRLQPARRWVIKAGRVVAETEIVRSIREPTP